MKICLVPIETVRLVLSRFKALHDLPLAIKLPMPVPEEMKVKVGSMLYRVAVSALRLAVYVPLSLVIS